jgi:hypothetical protein
MGYNAIFQVHDEPLPADKYITAEDIEGADCDHFYDHVRSLHKAERAAEIGELQDFMESIGIAVFHDDGSFTLTEDFREYFRDKYDTLLQIAADIQSMTFEQFATHSQSINMAALDQAYDQKYGTYIADYLLDDAVLDVTTFDTWLRGAVAGRKYYLGGVVLYHM